MKAGVGKSKVSVIGLAVLVPLGGYLVYSLFFDSDTPTVRPARVADGSVQQAANSADGSGEIPIPGRKKKNNRSAEFKPPLIQKKKEDRPDPAKIDPTIRLDLLAKIMKVPQAGAERDLFQILKAPAVKLAELPKIAEPKINVGPQPPAPPPPPQPPPVVVEPPPPPIPLKYYGITAIHLGGKRTAFFLDTSAVGTDQSDILFGAEGTILKGRYRVVQITPDKVLVEDTMAKPTRRQTLNIEPEPTG